MPLINDYFVTLPQDIALSVNADNLPITSSYVSIDASMMGIEITGLQAPVSGRQAARVMLKNASAFSITLKANNVSSDAENRFRFAVDLVLSPGEYAAMIKLDEGYFLQGVITP